MIDYQEFQETCALLLQHPWRFAKTMPHNPHWYTLRKEWQDSEFDRVVKTMRRHGYIELYGGRKYTMFNVNDMKYWTMGAPLAATILVNRKVISLPAPYDPIAKVYDDLFSDEASRAEDAALFDMLPQSDSVLDIGCGTGIFLEHRQPAGYTGIDPSRAMIDRFVTKFGDGKTVCTKFEDFYGGKYDLIVSLFGSASYIEPAALERIPAMLKPGGSYFLMFFRPGYVPVTYIKSGVFVNHFSGLPQSLPGTVREFGNFLIVTGP